jgi:hypothetical protein
LRELRRILSFAPILVAPYARELMLLYLAATKRVIVIVIVVEHKEKAHESLVENGAIGPVHLGL